jgi:hypothetical protein
MLSQRDTGGIVSTHDEILALGPTLIASLRDQGKATLEEDAPNLLTPKSNPMY